MTGTAAAAHAEEHEAKDHGEAGKEKPDKKKEEHEKKEGDKEPPKIQQETKAGVVSVFAGQFKTATTYEDKLRALDKIHPPLEPTAALDLLTTVNPNRDKGLVFVILEKVESAISPAQTKTGEKCVFETVLISPDTQLAFVAKMMEEGLAEHIVPLLKHAKSDDVRKALLKKMREQFKSEEDLFEAMKLAKSWEVMSVILDRVPSLGLSPEMVEKIKQSPEIDAGLLGNIFKKLKAGHQSKEAFRKSGPERTVNKVTSPIGKFFGKIGGFFSGIWGKFKSALGIGARPHGPVPPIETPSVEAPHGH